MELKKSLKHATLIETLRRESVSLENDSQEKVLAPSLIWQHCINNSFYQSRKSYHFYTNYYILIVVLRS